MAAKPELPTDNGFPEPPPGAPKFKNAQEAARIYFLPNLFTSGNLFFGFVAMISCIRARYGDEAQQAQLYTQAVECILLAAVCDALDGRVARLGGKESLFGKEYDSIADTVSFGVAPALMVFFLILGPNSNDTYRELFRSVGWLVGFIYLLCVAVRLARFNVLTNPLLPGVGADASSKDFMGLPSPAAAGFVASLVLVLLKLELRQWAIMLVPLLLLVAVLMVSNIPYPSFKHIGWQTQTKAQPFILFVVIAAIALTLREYSIAIFFLGYIFYGLGRYGRRAWRKRHEKPGTIILDHEMDGPEDEEDAF